MKQQTKSVLVWASIALALLFVASLINETKRDEPRTYAEFVREVRDTPKAFEETVLEVQMKGSSVAVHYERDGRSFSVQGPATDDLFALLNDKNIDYRVEPEEENHLLTIAIVLIPCGLLLVIMVMFMRQMQAGGGKAMSFGKSKARLLNEHTQKVTFGDVAGIEEARDEVEEIIDFLRNARKYTRVGGRIPKGILLMGPPGTGKTLLARAIAGEAGVAFFSISGSDFVEMFVGVGASRVRDLFEQGKRNAPCIIFIDEIDAVGRHRGAGLGGGHDEREQTLNQLLVEMDGFESNDGVILVAATNRPDVLDPALLRPGRFDRRIVVGLPDVRGREAILKVHTRKVPLAEDVDLSVVARGTPGFSGADLENLVNESALLAARNDRERVTDSDFDAARDKVMMGAERRNAHISSEEKLTTAWHEAGHTLVAKTLPKGTIDDIHKVTIIPRGQALGVTHLLPDQDRLSVDLVHAQGNIAMLMGGRLAEELRFDGRVTTGAGNDIAKASSLARKMVCEWGMSERLGPIAFSQARSEPFLGRDIQNKQSYSEATARAIDEEVYRIIDEQYCRAKKLLQDNWPALERIASALVEREVLSAQEVQLLVDGSPLPLLAAPKPEPEDPEREEPAQESDTEDSEASSTSSGPAGFPLAEPTA